MPKIKDSYRLNGRTPEELVVELNFLFARFADRMDKMEGIRGTSSIESDLDMNQNRVTEIGAGATSADAARVGDLTSSNPAFNSLSTAADLSVGGNLLVYDADDHLIHSME